MTTPTTSRGKDWMTAEDWMLLKLQQAALRAFWTMRERGRIAAVEACGASWIADYGPLPCSLPRGHLGAHRCWGSQGSIDFPTALGESP